MTKQELEAERKRIAQEREKTLAEAKKAETIPSNPLAGTATVYVTPAPEPTEEPKQTAPAKVVEPVLKSVSKP